MMKKKQINNFIILSIMGLLFSCSYKKKYENALLDAKKNGIYEKLYEEQKQYSYNIQDSLDIYKKELKTVLYNYNQTNNIESVDIKKIQSEREGKLQEELEDLKSRNVNLLQTIAKLDSFILVKGYNQVEESPEEVTNSHTYTSKKVHLINTFRNIESSYPSETKLDLDEEEISFSIDRIILFDGTYVLSEVGIEIIRQITQALNPLFGHEMSIQSEFSITDPYSDQWKEAIQGQIMLAQLMKRFGANQDRIDGENAFINGDNIGGKYTFILKRRNFVSP